MSRKHLIPLLAMMKSVREAAKDLVRSLGFTAETFGSADEALKSNHLHRASCLIADVQMPGMTGLDLHPYLGASGYPLLTVLTTAYPDDRVRVRALKAGVICYLTTVSAENDLLTCIDLALEHRRMGSIHDRRRIAIPGPAHRRSPGVEGRT